MKIIRDKLKEIGFVEERMDEYGWVRKYIYVSERERDGKYTVEILSKANWHFDITCSKTGYETGVEGYGPKTNFSGHISSIDSIHRLKILMESTPALGYCLMSTNILLPKNGHYQALQNFKQG